MSSVIWRGGLVGVTYIYCQLKGGKQKGSRTDGTYLKEKNMTYIEINTILAYLFKY